MTKIMDDPEMAWFSKHIAATPEGNAFLTAWRAQELALVALEKAKSGDAEVPASTAYVQYLRRNYMRLSDAASLALYHVEVRYHWPPDITYEVDKL